MFNKIKTKIGNIASDNEIFSIFVEILSSFIEFIAMIIVELIGGEA